MKRGEQRRDDPANAHDVFYTIAPDDPFVCSADLALCATCPEDLRTCAKGTIFELAVDKAGRRTLYGVIHHTKKRLRWFDELYAGLKPPTLDSARRLGRDLSLYAEEGVVCAVRQELEAATFRNLWFEEQPDDWEPEEWAESESLSGESGENGLAEGRATEDGPSGGVVDEPATGGRAAGGQDAEGQADSPSERGLVLRKLGRAEGRRLARRVRRAFVTGAYCSKGVCAVSGPYRPEGVEEYGVYYRRRGERIDIPLIVSGPSHCDRCAPRASSTALRRVFEDSRPSR